MQPADPVSGPGAVEAPPGGGAAEYEFSPGQGDTIAELADKMRFIGLFLIIGGVLTWALAVAGSFAGRTGRLHDLLPHSGGFLAGLIDVFLGVWTRRAAASLRRIVDTRGRDISHLMSALTELLNMYQLQYWLIIIALVLLAVTVPVVVAVLALGG